ncbi:zincin [Mollisia scopiformis]|uniref:Zincin n=1 Tax=Mollisia scopiformis TaxID=149040 RepID=A0A194X0H4_MOLSC|nr:zincin [Mollisia scopiformis]KUJ13367.1 zincin [Mollisia scopiformis]
MIVSSGPASEKEIVEAQPVPVRTELDKALWRNCELTDHYYDLVAKEDSVQWMTYDELEGVQSNAMIKWIQDPAKNPLFHKMGARSLGLKRSNGQLSEVARTAKRPETRRKVMEWEENACEHLAPLYKEMVLLRTEIAKLGRHKSFFEYKSHFKMMDARSVATSLEDLRKDLTPQFQSHMKSISEMTLKDRNFSASTTQLRQDVQQSGNDIQAFPASHEECQLHWGEVYKYSFEKRKKFPWREEVHDFPDYFPLNTTLPGLLSIFGHVFGIKFREILPDQAEYTRYVADYVAHPDSFSKAMNREDTLKVFVAHDTSESWKGLTTLGVVVFDSLKRSNKPIGGLCLPFTTYKLDRNQMVKKRGPGIAIQTAFERASTDRPTLLYPSDL